MTRTLVLLIAIVGSVACATVKSEHAVTGTPGPAYAGDVKIAMEGAAVPAAYDEVAIVSSTGTGEAAALPAVLSGLKSEAASLGCDAVIHVRYDRGASSASATGVAVRTR
jgi:hypothetical protein